MHFSMARRKVSRREQKSEYDLFMRKRIKVLFVLFVVAMFFAVGAFAQTETGSVTGTVSDPSGAVVPHAQVTLTSVGKQFTRTTTANANGQYSFQSLQPGTYEVTVNGQGYSPFKRRVEVTVGSRNTVDATLAVAGSSTVVEVTAEGGTQVNTQDQALSQMVTQSQITQLPTLTRNPYDLVVTAGNVSTSESQMGRGVGYSINGQRSASTDILLDGSENMDLFTAGVGTNVPLDSVQEFRVITSDFTAEYGRATGGVVNVATRSGTNALHGSVY